MGRMSVEERGRAVGLMGGGASLRQVRYFLSILTLSDRAHIVVSTSQKRNHVCTFMTRVFDQYLRLTHVMKWPVQPTILYMAMQKCYCGKSNMSIKAYVNRRMFV